MEFQSVGTGRGWDWISEGFAFFRKNPLIWIVQFIIFFVITTLLSLVPFVGSIASMLLQPVFVGGMLLGCVALEKGEELRIEHLFDGFRQSTKPLLMLGFYTGLASIAIGLLVALMIGGGAMGIGIFGEVSESPELASGVAAAGVLLAILVALLLMVPLAMATWFAPALVLFKDLAPLEALKTSFFACLRNLMPFLLYGLAILVLMILAILPAGLGLLVLGPTLIASVYVGFKDIFGGAG